MRLRYALAGLLCFPMAGYAQRGEFPYEPPEQKPWAEERIQLPAMPRDERLLEFFVGEAAGHRHFVDRDSIAVGDDGVIRFTLVIRTTGGATNVTYEGMRCSTRESKVYALAQGSSAWAELRAPEWRKIVSGSKQTARVVLYHDYFCPDWTIVRNAEEAVQALVRGFHERSGPGLIPSD